MTEDWLKRDQAMYEASRRRISPDLFHVANAQRNCHRVHRNNHRTVPVMDLPPMPPGPKKDRSYEHSPKLVGAIEAFKTTGLPHGGGETPQQFQRRRNARKRKPTGAQIMEIRKS